MLKRGEIIIATLSIVALGLNLFLIPGSGVLTVLSLSTLSVLYMYLSFALFNGIRLREIFRKESYEEISRVRIAGAVATGLALSLTTIGMLFKFQSWPGADFNLIVGLVGLFTATTIGAIMYSKNKSRFYIKVFKRVAVIGGLGLILMLIPNTAWLEIKYRHQPAYVAALKKALADPENEELWIRVDEERQKMDHDK